MELNVNNLLIKILIGISTCVLTGIYLLRKLPSSEPIKLSIESENFDKLELESVIKWFKKEEQFLNENKDLVPVLLKSGEAEKITGKSFFAISPYNQTLIQGLFDKNQMKLEKVRQLNCKAIDPDIEGLFDNKK